MAAMSSETVSASPVASGGVIAGAGDAASGGARSAEVDPADEAHWTEVAERLRAKLEIVPDYPKPGVDFKDYTSLLSDPAAFKLTIDSFARRYAGSGITHVVSAEARGLVLGAPLALALGLPFVPVRKPRKLPRETVGIDFTRHFNRSRLEVHADAVPKGAKVVIVDDVVSTGMTLEATAQLMELLGATVVELACISELPKLNGRQRLGSKRALFTLVPDLDDDSDDDDDDDDADPSPTGSPTA